MPKKSAKEEHDYDMDDGLDWRGFFYRVQYDYKKKEERSAVQQLEKEFDKLVMAYAEKFGREAESQQVSGDPTILDFLDVPEATGEPTVFASKEAKPKRELPGKAIKKVKTARTKAPGTGKSR